MNEIICLTDYKDLFGSKWSASPYRSGLDKNTLASVFKKFDYQLKFTSMSEVDFTNPNWKGANVIYTSSEEYDLYYKSFIEDIVTGLEAVGANLLPHSVFLRANNNKSFMEIIRQIKLPANLQTIDAKIFGTYDELDAAINKGWVPFPCVIKKSAGAMSRGVYLAKNEKELKKKAKQICYTGSLKIMFKELLRAKKHKGYLPESLYQNKFIIQPFVKGLANDWKVLIYGEKIFVLKRNIKKNDFRASGSGLNYTSGSKSDFPMELLNFVREFFLTLDVPNLSIDIAYDGNKPYVFEFQAIHFGTSTHYKSIDYYEYSKGNWILKPNDITQEEVFVYSIIEFLKRKNV